MIEYHYIYLLKEKRYIDEDREVYKIGKSTQENTKRVKSYPSGSKLYLQIRCINCHVMEKKLIMIFNETFKLYRGREYFLGDIELMMDIVYNEIRDDCSSNGNQTYVTILNENKKLLKENRLFDKKLDELDEINRIINIENEKNMKEIHGLYNRIRVDKDKIEDKEIENQRLLKEIQSAVCGSLEMGNDINRLMEKNNELNGENKKLKNKYNEDIKLRDNIIVGYTKTVEYLEDEINNYKELGKNKDKELDRVNDKIIEIYLELEKSKNSYRYIDMYSIYLFVSYPIRLIWKNCGMFTRRKDPVKDPVKDIYYVNNFRIWPSFIS